MARQHVDVKVPHRLPGHGAVGLEQVQSLGRERGARGLPSFLSYGVYLGEVLAPILVILGLFSRLGALIIIANMLFVFGLVHMADLLTLSKTGGWTLELQGFFLFTGLAVLLLGAGRFSLGGINGRWN